MPVETLTYGALAARLDISIDAARSLARRLCLPRSRSTDGKALVTADVDEIKQSRSPVAGRIRIEALQAEVARLGSTAAMHRADFERERDRAEQLAAALAELAAETASAKEAAARLEGELAAMRSRAREQPPGRLGRLAASVVSADRKALR